MSVANGCKVCVPGRPCDACREGARLRARASRAARGMSRQARTPQCFRCLGTHPMGEANCPLAAEYWEARS